MENKKIYILFVTAALILFLFFLFTRKSEHKYNWRETYMETQKDPYGSYVIHQLLQNYFPKNNFKEITTSLQEQLPERSNNPANYVMIGEAMYYDSVDVARLLQFVENGNTAFISTKTIPFDLMSYIYQEECHGQFWNDYSMLEDSVVRLNFFHSELHQDTAFSFQYIYRHTARFYDWQYIDSLYFCMTDSSMNPLGAINDTFVNFARQKYGEGYFYLHTTPLAFSNIQLMNSAALKYAGNIFSHLPEGNIYWDAAHRVDASIGRRRNEQLANRPSHGLSGDGPLKYILAQPPLAWAWYLGLALTLAYLFFHAKRKQRIIPVLEVKSNSSLEFLTTIGSLYFLRQDHKKLALQKMRLFLSYIRERYNMPTNEMNEQFVDRLSVRSEVEPLHIFDILRQFEMINKALNVNNKTLIRFHQAMDRFYKKCK